MKIRSKKLILFIFTIIIVGFFVFSFDKIQAVDSFDSFNFGFFGKINRPDDSMSGKPGTILNTVFSTIITIAEVTFIIMFLVGGVMYLTSMGDEEASKKAKKLLVDAVIGIVIVLAAWAIGTWILNTLRGNSTANTSNVSTNDAVDGIIKNLGKNNSGGTNSGSTSNSNETNDTLTAVGYSVGIKDGFISGLCAKTYNSNKDSSKYSTDANYRQSYDIGFSDGSNKYQEWTKNASATEINTTKMSACPNAL